MAKREHGKAAAWRVCFDGSFWGQKGRAGQELRVDRTAAWDGRMVCIPSVYLCGKGIVLDILTRAEPEAIRAFAEKWRLSPENDGSELTGGQRELCMAENPLRAGYSPALCVNGKSLKGMGAAALRGIRFFRVKALRKSTQRWSIISWMIPAAGCSCAGASHGRQSAAQSSEA